MLYNNIIWVFLWSKTAGSKASNYGQFSPSYVTVLIHCQYFMLVPSGGSRGGGGALAPQADDRLYEEKL